MLGQAQSRPAIRGKSITSGAAKSRSARDSTEPLRHKKRAGFPAPFVDTALAVAAARVRKRRLELAPFLEGEYGLSEYCARQPFRLGPAKGHYSRWGGVRSSCAPFFSFTSPLESTMILVASPFASFRISNRMFAKPLTPTLEAVSRPLPGVPALTLPGTVAAVVAPGIPRPSAIVLFEGWSVSGAKA